VKLAAGLNLTTIAEGVETFEQLLLLGPYGCKRMQGFLFGKPVPPELFATWLDNPPFRWVQGCRGAARERSLPALIRDPICTSVRLDAGGSRSRPDRRSPVQDYGDTVAVDGIGSRRRPARSSVCSARTAPARPPRST
jgi:hypothetical protein